MDCLICHKPAVKPILDLGLQAISNRFLLAPTASEFKYPLILGSCEQCALVQLINPVPSAEVTPRFDWIRYTEPEKHLDDVMTVLAQLPGLTQTSAILGISDIDQSCLDRLKQLGFSNLHTIQHAFTPAAAKTLIAEKGSAQCILARYILEHVHQPAEFMQALRTLLDPDGYILLEVPNNEAFFASLDYSIIWEEHLFYFTRHTFLNALAEWGFEICFYRDYSYALLVIVRPKKSTTISLPPMKSLAQEQACIDQYAAHFAEQKQWYQQQLAAYKKQGRIALLGAGHLAIHFINLLDLKDYIDFVVDDHPAKAGLFLPGSQLPILNSSALQTEGIQFCLMTVSLETEPKVIARQHPFIARGGRFFSIFPNSPYALRSAV